MNIQKIVTIPSKSSNLNLVTFCYKLIIIIDRYFLKS